MRLCETWCLFYWQIPVKWYSIFPKQYTRMYSGRIGSIYICNWLGCLEWMATRWRKPQYHLKCIILNLSDLNKGCYGPYLIWSLTRINSSLENRLLSGVMGMRSSFILGHLKSWNIYISSDFACKPTSSFLSSSLSSLIWVEAVRRSQAVPSVLFLEISLARPSSSLHIFLISTVTQAAVLLNFLLLHKKGPLSSSAQNHFPDSSLSSHWWPPLVSLDFHYCSLWSLLSFH